jgi:hypothetical protein
VAACFEDEPMHVLALASGATVAEVEGVRRITASRFASVGLGEAEGHAVLLGMDASGRYLVTSAGEVRDTRDGALVWTF